MPGFGTIITSIERDGNQITFNGDHFSENQFNGYVWLSKDGGLTKIYPVSYVSWEYNKVIAIFESLSEGVYVGGLRSGSEEDSNVIEAFIIYPTKKETYLSATFNNEDVVIIGECKDGHNIYIIFKDSMNRIRIASRFVNSVENIIATNVQVI